MLSMGYGQMSSINGAVFLKTKAIRQLKNGLLSDDQFR